MDDIIFEKDYRETESVEYDKWCDEVFDRAVNGGRASAGAVRRPIRASDARKNGGV